MLLESLERFEAAHGPRHRKALEAVHMLQRVYHYWGREESAARWAVELAERQGGPF